MIPDYTTDNSYIDSYYKLYDESTFRGSHTLTAGQIRYALLERTLDIKLWFHPEFSEMDYINITKKQALKIFLYFEDNEKACSSLHDIDELWIG